MTMATEIYVRPDCTAIVDEQDLELLGRFRWALHKAVCGTGKPPRRPRFYAMSSARSRSGRITIYMHRLILAAPPQATVDHKDGNGLNNTRNNLRLADRSQQNGNTRLPPSESGFRGVVRHRSRSDLWRARIQFKKRTTELGLFDRIEDAARAYDEAALQMFGEFATLNFSRSE